MKIIALNASGKGQATDFMHSIGNYASTKGVTYCYAVGANANREYHDFLIHRFSVIRFLSKVLSRLTGKFDYYFKIGTKRLIRWIKKEKPDIVHIHNLHGDYINLEMLVNFLKESNIKVVFSLHDTWLFTGKCLDYENEECLKWKRLCKDCPQKKKKPRWLFGDASTKNYLRKKALFSDFEKAVYITNFEWLKTQLPKTLLKAKRTYCIFDGVDTTRFYPHLTIIKEKHHIPENKKIILCYADKWEKNTSLLAINQLTEIMGLEYQFIALNAPRKSVSKKAIVIRKVKDTSLLAEYFASATMFINLSVDNIFPLENLFAFASGVPVFTFAFGRTPEQINSYVGKILPDFDPIKIKKEIIAYFGKHYDIRKECLEKAEEFNIEKMVKKYYEVYVNILKKKS